MKKESEKTVIRTGYILFFKKRKMMSSKHLIIHKYDESAVCKIKNSYHLQNRADIL